MATDTFSVQGTPAVPGKFWTVAPWLSRLVMMPPVLIFTLISTRFLANPGHSVPGVTLNSPEAFTDMRVVAAWMLTFVVMLLVFLSNRKSLWLGHLQLSVILGLALGLRIFGFIHDGTTMAMGNQRPITIVESVLLILNVLGLVLQNNLRRQTEVRP
jgi:hypothetical protein